MLISRILLIHRQSLIVPAVRLHKHSRAEHLFAVRCPCGLLRADVPGGFDVVAFAVFPELAVGDGTAVDLI